ncbi:MAG: WD40 repeat domain-containing protein, partial [Bacteroidota bacterium]
HFRIDHSGWRPHHPNQLALAEGDRIYILDVGKQALLSSRKFSIPYEKHVFAMQWSHNGEYLAITHGHYIEVWPAEGDEPVVCFEEGTQDYTSVSFSYNDRFILVSELGVSMTFINLKNRQKLKAVAEKGELCSNDACFFNNAPCFVKSAGKENDPTSIWNISLEGVGQKYVPRIVRKMCGLDDGSSYPQTIFDLIFEYTRIAPYWRWL